MKDAAMTRPPAPTRSPPLRAWTWDLEMTQNDPIPATPGNETAHFGDVPLPLPTPVTSPDVFGVPCCSRPPCVPIPIPAAFRYFRTDVVDGRCGNPAAAHWL